MCWNGEFCRSEMMLVHPEVNFSAVAVLWQTSDQASLFSYFHISCFLQRTFFLFLVPLLAESSLSFATTTGHPGLCCHYPLAGLSFTSQQWSTERNCFWKTPAKITVVFPPYSVLVFSFAFSLSMSKPSGCLTDNT